MANTSYLIKSILHKSLAEGVYRDIVTRKSNYYYVLGKTIAWNTDDDPPYPIDSYDYERLTRSEAISYKAINASDVSFVANRINWQSNTIYDMYDDSYSGEVIGLDLISGGSGYTSLPVVEVVGGGGTGAVYGAIVDTGTGKIIGVQQFSKGSGYTSIPSVTITGGGGIGGSMKAVVEIGPNSGAHVLEDTKFYVLTDDFNVYKCIDNNNNSVSTSKPSGTQTSPILMPDGYIWKYMYNIPIGLRNKFLTTEHMPVIAALTNQFYSNGQLDAITINTRGSNYTSANIIVSGDGYRESDPVYIQSIQTNTGGSGYTSSSVVTISDPFTDASAFVAGSSVSLGQKIYNSTKDFYEVASPGTLGGVEASHTAGYVRSDSYIGTLWKANTVVALGDQYYYGANLYQVTTAGTTGGTPPTSTGGTAFSDGSAYLIYVKPTPKGTAVLKYLGSTATATATLSGSAISSINLVGSLKDIEIVNAGSGYTSAPVVNVTGGGGANGRAYCKLNGTSVLYAEVIDQGKGYTSDPTITFGTQWASGAYASLYDQLYYGTNLYTVSAVSTPLRIDQAYYQANFKSVNSQDGTPSGLTFNSTGTKMWMIGSTADTVNYYTLSQAWNISTATYVNNTSISAVEANASGMMMSSDGTKLYLVGTTNDTVFQYTLSTPYDVTTKNTLAYANLAGVTITGTAGQFSCTSTTLSVGQTVTITGTLGGTGTITGYTTGTVYKISATNGTTTFTLINATTDAALVTTAGTPTGLTYSSSPGGNSFSILDKDTTSGGLEFSEDGTKMYVVGSSTDTIYQYNLATAWNISTAVYSQSFSISSQSGTSTDFHFSDDGKYILVIDNTSDYVYQYNLTTAWDISTAVYSTSVYIGTQEGTSTGIWLKADNAKMYVLGTTNDSVYEYIIPLRSVLSGTAPSHTTGSAVTGDVTLTYAGTAATATASRKYGAGYTKAPTVSVSIGSNFTYSLYTTKSEAKLIPILENGQVSGVSVVDSGVGYTNAVLTVNSTSGAGATLSANLTVGNIQSLQANNEILSVAGAVDAIKIISGGYGYGTATVSIIGDGSDAAASAVINDIDGSIEKITITNRGYGYTFANVVIYGNGFGATARAIMPPFGGHGRNAPDELFARTLMFYTNMSSDLNQGLSVNNDYRQVGIVKNPYAYGTTNRFTSLLGSGCFVVQASIDTALFPKDSLVFINRGTSWVGNTAVTAGTKIYYGENLYLVTQDGTTGASGPSHTYGTVANGSTVLLYVGTPRRYYRIVVVSTTSALLQSLNNDTPTVSDTLLNSNNNSFKPLAVGYPTVDKYSGQLMYIDNKAGFTPSDNETVTFRTVIKF
ncbi:hypothetical protein UFOVP240_204 [uncultured Caudovirales phage]|uniref:Uncharacterized protein n=1 Tax=uncultured Caudovirales phage TaxID=2100421 RepID=A0A6J7WV12_9CAUD|nr:hypothetical protein UFOVP240_204 [uncultured Caudovirales phage]